MLLRIRWPNVNSSSGSQTILAATHNYGVKLRDIHGVCVSTM